MEDESWRARLEVSATGRLVPSVETTNLYLRHHKRLRGRVRFDGATPLILFDGEPLNDGHVHEVRAIMMQERIKPSLEVVRHCLHVAAMRETTRTANG